MAKVQEIGPYSAYAIAVKYGYKGTEEEWVKEQEANRKAAEAAAAAAAQSAKDAAASASGVAQSGQQAVQSIKDAQTAAEQAIDTAKQQAVQAAQAEAEKAATSAGQAASSAAEAAQSATNAAAEVGKVQSAGTSAVQAVQEAQNTATEAVSAAQQSATQAVSQAQTAAVSAVQEAGATQASAVQSAGTTQISQVNSAGAAQVQAVKAEGAAQTSALDDAAAAHKTELEAIASHPPQPNTETGKWQVWNAETGAYQDTDALYQGGYYTASVSDDGTLTWQGSQEGMPELPSVNIKGPKGDKGDPGLGVPSPAQSDAGKVPTVKADGSAYELAGPYAPLSAAIRPPASGNPVNITDSVEWPLQGLKVYGKSVQDGTPSPESPVPIVSAGGGGSIALTISDGADQSQSLTISTPNGLPGIPVDSGGNYTDAEGQQWVCNYKDYVRGVYVQRCALEKIVGTPNFSETSDRPGRYVWWGVLANTYSNGGVKALSTFGKWKNWGLGVEIGFAVDGGGIYFNYLKSGAADEVNALFSNLIETNQCYVLGQLAAPIETPLTPEELAAYRALHTYDGTTVISTPEDVAGLEVRYVADAQKYIDNRLAAAESHIQEIAAAQLNAQTGG